jgi:hypothetical protein
MNNSPVNGVSSLGLITTALPAAGAAGACIAMEMSGAFHVMTSPTTPYG